MRDFYPIDREAFEAWLTDNRDSVVGRACAACDCPVVNFIKYTDTSLPKCISKR
jgi:hypothetical protein